MNKWYKRITGGVAAACMMLTSNVVSFADTDNVLIDDVKCIDGRITVTGKADAEEYITLRMIKDGTFLRDDGAVFAVEEVKTDEKGFFSVSFIIPDERSGESTKGSYILKFVSDSDKTTDCEFEYSSADERAVVMATVREVSTKSDFISLFTDENKTALLNVGVSEDLVLAEEPVLIETAELITQNESFEGITQDKLNTITNEYVKLAKVNTQNESSVKAVLAEINPDCGEKLFGEYKNNEQTFINAVVYKNRQYSTTEELSGMCKVAVALNKVNTAKYAEMYDVLDANKDMLGINGEVEYSDYKALKSTTAADKLIVEALRKEKVYDIQALLAVIDKAIRDADSDTGNGSGGGGRGGSSAGSSNAGNNYVVPSNATEIANANKPFTDMDINHWAYSYVSALKEKKIISGYEDNSFRPSNNVTREECVKMIVAITGSYDANAVCSFEDVKQGEWYAPYVASAVKAGIVNGVSETSFGTGNFITREDVAVIVSRILQNNSYFDLSKVTDKAQISDYALSGVAALYEKGILSGDETGAFRPKDNITRAEFAKIIYMSLEESK